MVVYCCVPLCYNNAKMPGETFHAFPTNTELKKRWISRIARDGNKSRPVSSTMRVCSRHFLKTDYKVETFGFVLKRKRLRAGAVPSIFPTTSSSTLKSPQQELQVSNDSKTSDLARALEDLTEIKTRIEIKEEPLDSSFGEENTQSDTCIENAERVKDIANQTKAARAAKLKEKYYRNREAILAKKKQDYLKNRASKLEARRNRYAMNKQVELQRSRERYYRKKGILHNTIGQHGLAQVAEILGGSCRQRAATCAEYYALKENGSMQRKQLARLQKDTFGMPLETYPIKVEQEDPTALVSLTCTLCYTEYPTQTSFRDHLLSTGKFFTCRKALEMNQPTVHLVRVDYQCKMEPESIKIKIEKPDFEDENLMETADQNQTGADANSSVSLGLVDYQHNLIPENIKIKIEKPDFEDENFMERADQNQTGADENPSVSLVCVDYQHKTEPESIKIKIEKPDFEDENLMEMADQNQTGADENPSVILGLVDYQHKAVPEDIKIEKPDFEDENLMETSDLNQAGADANLAFKYRLEMNQPTVPLVRIDFLYKIENGTVKIECEKCDSDDLNLNEMPLNRSNHSGGCSNETLSIQQREKHIELGEIFNCLICSKSLQNKRSLTEHLKVYHNLKVACVQGTNKVKEFITARPRAKDKNVKKVCFVCSHVFATFEDLNLHLIEMHSKSIKYQCNLCDAPFITAAECLVHCNRCRFAERQNTCVICAEAFACFSELFTHFRAVHPGLLPLKCKHCEYKCDGILPLSEHARLCSLERLSKLSFENFSEHDTIACPICSVKTSTTAELYEHYFASHMDSVSLLCQICLGEFVSKEAFATHLWKCLLANGTADEKSCRKNSSKVVQDRRLNMNPNDEIFDDEAIKSLTPAQDNSFTCSVCLCSFEDRLLLSKHLRSRHFITMPERVKERCFVCYRDPDSGENANEPFRSGHIFGCRIVAKDSSVQDQEKVNESASLICPGCGETYATQDDLALHKKICVIKGSGFFCFTCTRKLVTPQTTKRELMLSNPELAQACNKCVDLFATSITLVSHMNSVHSFKLAYVCFVCVSAYCRRQDLFKHMATHSNDSKTRGKGTIRITFPRKDMAS